MNIAPAAIVFSNKMRCHVARPGNHRSSFDWREVRRCLVYVLDCQLWSTIGTLARYEAHKGMHHVQCTQPLKVQREPVEAVGRLNSSLLQQSQNKKE
jgi:hypothetical protein